MNKSEGLRLKILKFCAFISSSKNYELTCLLDEYADEIRKECSADLTCPKCGAETYCPGPQWICTKCAARSDD